MATLLRAGFRKVYIASFALALALSNIAVALAKEPAHEGAHEEAHNELPNFMSIIHGLYREPIDAYLAKINTNLPRPLHIEWVNIENLTFAFLMVGILSTIAIVTSRQRALRPKSKLYIFMEWVVDSLTGFFTQVLGRETKRYIPLVGTLFIYILSLNLFGLIPLMKSPTSVWGINLAMALSVFVYVQWTGIVRNGIIGYLKHFVGELPSAKELGCLGIILIPFLVTLNIVLHIVEELIKPVSLSLRLFGNILGEDTLLGVLAGLMFLIPGFVKFPWHFPFLFLAILFSTIQALIFSMLTAVYILLMLPHEEAH